MRHTHRRRHRQRDVRMRHGPHPRQEPALSLFLLAHLAMVPIGFSLQPEVEFMGLLEGVLRETVDYYEVAPETLWRVDASGALGPNGFHERFAEMGRQGGKPFVAHGVGVSVGSSGHADASRRRRWLGRLVQ